MRFEQYLTEASRKPLISVDIQPQYERWFSFKTYEYVDFLNDSVSDILFFYNGPDTVGEDNKDDIIMWLIENGLDERKINDFVWVDKGYGFFRSWMDLGMDEHKRVYDSRDIELEEWQKLYGDDWDDVEHIITSDAIFMPDIDINLLRKYRNSWIAGGGKCECLKEIKLFMSAFNIKAKEVRRFIYG
jgi:hypothetical protein